MRLSTRVRIRDAIYELKKILPVKKTNIRLFFVQLFYLNYCWSFGWPCEFHSHIWRKNEAKISQSFISPAVKPFVIWAQKRLCLFWRQWQAIFLPVFWYSCESETTSSHIMLKLTRTRAYTHKHTRTQTHSQYKRYISTSRQNLVTYSIDQQFFCFRVVSKFEYILLYLVLFSSIFK